MRIMIDRRDFMRRMGLSLAAATLLPSGLTRLAAAAATPATRPNILLIITDQQHAGMLSCTGNPWLKTPNMDALAATGTRFERAYCGNPVCVPSRFTMLTGCLPSSIGMEDNGQIGNPVPREIMNHSLGRVFRAAGYQTVYGGKTHVPAASDSPATGQGKKKGKKKAGAGGAIGGYGFDTILTPNEREELARLGADFLRQPHDRPFLLVASLINPHDICYMAINDYAQRDRPDKESFYRNFAANVLANKGVSSTLQSEIQAFEPGKMHEFVQAHCPPLPANHEIPAGEPEGVQTIDWRPFRPSARQNWVEDTWRLHRWAYARLTEVVDREIGILLQGLREGGRQRDTVVVFVSDHGDMDSAHRLEHKSMLYEEATRVPLICSWPGVTAAGGVDREHLVSTGLDLIPTLCDFAGIPIPPELPGRSVRALAEGRKPEQWREDLVVENEASRVIHWGGHKYMVYAHGKEREGLVDLKSDPGEMKNLARDPACRPLLLEGRRRLKQWYQDHAMKLDAAYIIV